MRSTILLSYINFPFQTSFNLPVMRSHLHLLLAAVITLFVSCNKNAVTLSDTNAKGEVQLLGNLVFHFNKPLVPDSLLNRWDSIPYVQFEPRISGRFRWEHSDELVFSPAVPLLPATTYKATLGKEVLAYNEYDKVVVDKPCSFIP